MAWLGLESWQLFLGTFVLTLFLSYVLKRKKGSSRPPPPGPRTLPILGNLHLMGDKPHITFTKLWKEYGNVYSFKFGSWNAVVLNGHKAIRDALNEPAFSGRHLPTAAFPREGGIVLNEGKSWTEQRRFCLKTLRDFGFGKKSTESIMTEEITELIEGFKKVVGSPKDFTSAFNAAVLNVLWNMVTGKRFSHDDPRLHDLIKRLNGSVQAEGFSVLVKLSFFIPWLAPLRKILPQPKQVDDFVKATMKLLQEIIQEHKETFEPGVTEERDFVDAYLNEMQNTSDANSSFYGTNGEKNLPIVLFDLFIAGTETSATTMAYTFQYLAIHPQVQEKLYEEIKKVVGTSRLPNLSDRQNLPYVEATIFEILRHSSLLPRSLLHKTTEDVDFHGFRIEAGSIVVPNLYSAHYDSSYWRDPENFRPERWFAQDGTLIRHDKALLPFSVGKRVCLGEQLAKDVLLKFITCLVQRFRVLPDPNAPPLEIEYFVTPLTLSPIPKSLILQDRETK